MSDVVIPWGILFYLGVRWLMSSSQETADPDESSEPPISYYPTGIKYFSNGNIIDEPLHIYYIRKLNLLHTYHCIYDDTIREAVKQKFQEIEDREFFYQNEIDEVAAAKQFLLDQWNYVVWKN